MEERQKPKTRPQSLMAQNFSLALDSVFGLDNDKNELFQSVEKRKQEVSTQNAELQALEARLQAMEERLKTKQRSATLSSGSGPTTSARPVGDIRPANNASSARQVQRPSVTQSKGTTRPPPGKAANSRVPQNPLQRKVEESSDEDEDDDDEDDSDEEEDDEEEAEESDDSDTDDSSSAEESK